MDKILGAIIENFCGDGHRRRKGNDLLGINQKQRLSRNQRQRERRGKTS